MNVSQQTKQTKKQKKKKVKNTSQLKPLPAPTSAPVAKMRAFVNNGDPKVVSMTSRSWRIRHREMVDPVNTAGSSYLFAPVAGMTNGLPLNPGMDATFSWLSNVALNWERYKFHALKFIYLTRSPTSQAGSVILAPDYDPADTAPIDELTALSYKDAKEDVPWKDIVVTLDPSDLSGGRKDHFVRTGPLAANLDIKTYDSGTLWVYTEGVASSVNLGKLFVEYDVELFTPQLPPTGDPITGSMELSSAGGGLSAAAPFGAAPAINILSNLASLTPIPDIISFKEAASTVLMSAATAGTGLGSWLPPSFVAGPGAVNVFNATVTNAAATTANVVWKLTGIDETSLLQLPKLSAATTVIGSNTVLSKLVPNII